ncbi:metal ABC transporter substrate-binding protein [Rubrobacter indicoceani]|uniref:metal ABC transporter substrate-binding protein n=1 Tax=Rubrobacter indicoceani TaxID=2051957 RepID=UPI000E5AA7DF|nr:metal ABC transporter substrate-binding protein [Rubrobacter indicoceani]
MRGFSRRSGNAPRRRRGIFALPTVFVASAAIVASGCGAQGGSSEGGSGQDVSGEGSGGGQGVSVVASTTQIADFVRNVGGDAVEEHQILQPNTDPHDYEPRPEDVRQTAGADLVFMNGQDLDPWVEDVVSESGSEAQTIDLSQSLSSPIEGAGEEHSEEGEAHEDEAHSDEAHADAGDEHAGEASAEGEAHSDEANAGEEDVHESEYDPHWWHDPRNAESAVEEIRDSLIEVDPENEQVYRDNAEAYLGELGTLDSEIESCLTEVPEDERKLVTDHEAFGYFTERYGIEQVGAVIPSQSTQGQASAGDTAELIETIESEGVLAVFPEESINASLAETIADETGATAEYTLYGDTLGPEGSDGDTYLKMMAANANSMTQGFTGGESTCEVPAGN